MPFDIIIVGAGIAGLGAAIAHANKGHTVTLLEATSQLRPIGGIMALQANGNRVLDDLGVYESLLPICTIVPHGPSTRRYHDGKFLITLPAEAHEREYGYPLWPVHRADLQRVLYKAAKSRGVNIIFGCAVLAVETNGKLVAVEIKGGQRVMADLVIGADGIESSVRRSIAPGPAWIRDSNMDITRATIPAATVRSNAETSEFMDHISLWCGPFASIAAMPVRRGDELLLGLDCCHRRHGPREEGRDRSQNVEQLRKTFKDFSPAMQKVLSYVQEARVWTLRESIPSSWVGSCGKIVLIGDAAHGALPWVGQGGSMALEDAVTLAECLDRAKSTMDIPDVLNAFQEIRQPRCKQVQEWSAIKGHRATLPDGPEQEERDKKLTSSNAWVRADCWNKRHIDEVPEHESSNWKAWLSGHNAVQFANRELDKRFSIR